MGREESFAAGMPNVGSILSGLAAHALCMVNTFGIVIETVSPNLVTDLAGKGQEVRRFAI